MKFECIDQYLLVIHSLIPQLFFLQNICNAL